MWEMIMRKIKQWEMKKKTTQINYIIAFHTFFSSSDSIVNFPFYFPAEDTNIETQWNTTIEIFLVNKVFLSCGIFHIFLQYLSLHASLNLVLVILRILNHSCLFVPFNYYHPPITILKTSPKINNGNGNVPKTNL